MIVLNIKNSILPTKKVECVIVDSNAPKSLLAWLDEYKIKYIKSGFISNTIDAVSTHPDMQICYIGNNNYVCEPSLYDYYSEKMKKYNVNVIKGEKIIPSTYPDDISYNVVITEKIFMHNFKYTDKVIRDYIESTGISIYNVKQGYTKCATCVVGDTALITSDENIYKTCMLNNIDCLLIEKDNIKLGSRNDGFIGGCCGLIDYKTLLFCGDISSHKSYNEIMKFTSKYNVEIISSSNETLTDVGSIIPVIHE